MTERSSDHAAYADQRGALAAERTEVLERIADLTADFDAMVAASAASNADDEHDPEGATIAFERAQVVALLTHTRGRLTEIDDALARLDDGSYGICSGCGGQIAAERLTARPSARTCITCATAAP